MLTLRFAALSTLFFFASNLWAADAVVPQTLRYAIVSNNKVAGSEVDTYGPDGRIDSAFEFNDRGRGPKSQRTTSSLRMDFHACGRDRQRLFESSGG